MKELLELFNKEYEFLYEAESKGKYVAGTNEAVEYFDNSLTEEEKEILGEFSRYRMDVIASDREAAAFMFVLDIYQASKERELEEKRLKEKAYFMKNYENYTEEEVRESYYIDMIFRSGANSPEEVKLLDYYYLQRDPIESIEYTINDDKILVASDSTNYINVKSVEYIDIEKLLETRQEIYQKARKLNASVSYANKTKGILEDIKKKYEMDYASSLLLYTFLKDRCKHIRDIRGVRMGVTDDIYLKNTNDTKRNYNALNMHNKPLGIVKDVKGKLENAARILEDLESGYIQGAKIIL